MRIELFPQQFSGSVRIQAHAEARLRPRRLGRTSQGEDDEWMSSADRAYCEWSAERKWEDDGGREEVSPGPRARRAPRGVV